MKKSIPFDILRGPSLPEAVAINNALGALLAMGTFKGGVLELEGSDEQVARSEEILKGVKIIKIKKS